MPYLQPFQAEALAALASAEIHLALTAPTGAGKGVILETLARSKEERVLLISPLIALGRQQSLRFQSAGVPCYTAMGQGSEQRKSIPKESRVWILSPESALAPARVREIRDWQPTLIAVDEAHCLQEWGENFRPAYARLIELVLSLGHQRTLWMSATFPRKLFAELRSKIHGRWEQHGTFKISPTLRIREERVAFPDRVERIVANVAARSTPGLVFAGPRKNVGRYIEVLTPLRVFLPYHAGMSDEERRNVEKKLLRENSTLPGIASTSVVATNAFGMGMDFPQFDWVVLAQVPFSLLGYMQALGRVGRAGKPGYAETLWAEEDFRIAGYLVGSADPTRRSVKDLATLRHYLESDAATRESILAEEFL